MEALVAPVTNITLDLERHLAEQVWPIQPYQTLIELSLLSVRFFGFKHISAILGLLTQTNSDGNSTDFLTTKDFGII